MHELCMHCDHEKNKHKGREQRIMYDRIPAQFVESVPGPKQAESKIFTELGKKQGQTKCPSGLGSDQRERMFGVFLHCSAVLSDHMGHPQPSLSGTGVLWVSTGTHQCVDPPRQGGGSTMPNPLAAALLLHCTELCTCVREHIEHAATNTQPRSTTRVVNLGRFGLHCVAPYTFNLNSLEKEIFHIPCHAR